tara:strand:- start:86 stop:1861 length:1776 start_codon:yes stop_codon:yes gene_type:complete
MAKFLDKKERVIDFQLTPYGKHRLAIGKLKPAFYAFFDQGVLYDSEYAGFSEVQNNIHERIKNKTQFIEGVLSFEEVENSSPPSTFLGGIETYKYAISSGGPTIFQTLDELRADSGLTDEELLSLIDITPEVSLYSGVSLFDLDVVPQKFIPKPKMLSFESAIGDARFEGANTQAAPAWKIVSCQGEMSNITTKDTTKYNFSSASFDNEETEFNIPQINVDAYYTKLITKYDTSIPYFDSISETNTQTPIFADGNIIKLIRDDIVIYGEEVNTELLNENFDVEVFEMEEDNGVETKAAGLIGFNIAREPDAGDTITISDGLTTATFEFVNSGDDATGLGNIAVVKSSDYTLLGAPNQNRKGTLLNLASAINQDSGERSLGYPTDPYFGSTGAGGSVLNKGRCSSTDDPVGCYKGNHNLKVRIPRFGDGEGYATIASQTGTLTVKIINTNVVGNVNQTILKSDADDDITVEGFSGGFIAKGAQLKRKFFTNDVPQIVDGLMLTGTPTDIGTVNFTPDDVNYFFNILTDSQVDTKIACACASTYNRSSYYIDIDFECDEETIPEIFYDIYGSVTSPEVCEPVADPAENCSDNE